MSFLQAIHISELQATADGERLVLASAHNVKFGRFLEIDSYFNLKCYAAT